MSSSRPSSPLPLTLSLVLLGFGGTTKYLNRHVNSHSSLLVFKYDNSAAFQYSVLIARL